MKHFILFLFNIVFINCYSQISFQEHLIKDGSNILTEPRTVVSADIDGDGDMDVISASYGDIVKIGWFENLDGSTISENLNIISTEVENISSLFVADVDNDGDMDIFGTAKVPTNNIFWFKNLNGLGNFSSVKIINNFAGRASSVYLKDIDGDEDLDLVIALIDTNKINWHENLDGIGNFGEQNTVTDVNASDPRSIFVDDFDGDGDNDILYSSYQDGVFWVENEDGQGDFNVVHTIGEFFGSTSNAIAKDLDGDGDLDIIASKANQLLWYENIDGQGDFSLEHLIAASVNINYIQATDINNDGYLDITVANNDRAGWFENIDGQGLFGSENEIPHNTNNNNREVYSIYTVDIDDDGDIDVLSTCGDDMVRLFKNNDGLGNFDTDIRINFNAGAGTYVIVEDIDNDGDLDVFTGGRKIAWFENENGRGDFGNPRSIDPNAYYTNAMYFTDVDGDGLKDLIYSGTFWDEIIWRKNLDGQGNFGSKNVIFGGFGEIDYPSFFVADVDGDGLNDLITESKSESQLYFLSWHKKLTDGTYGDRQVIEEFIWPSNSIYADDVDNDGDIDILYSDQYFGRILWYKNTNGLGNFVFQQIITNDVEGRSKLYTSDFDGDGDKDLVSASFDDNKIAWYENTDGNGLFGNQQIISTEAEGATSVKAVDLDNDGDMDVISSSYYDDKIAWYENLNGLGSFGDQEIITLNAEGAHLVDFADIDNDGDIDVLSASGAPWSNFKIAWHENSLILGVNASNQLDFTLYPNPTSGKLTIDSNQTINNIEVYSQLGQLILSVPNKNEIDISFLNSGMYFIKISDKKGNTIVKKVIKK